MLRGQARGLRDWAWFGLIAATFILGIGPVQAQGTAQAEGLREVTLAADAFHRAPNMPGWAQLSEAPTPRPTGVATQVLLSESHVRVAPKRAWLLHRVTQVHDVRDLGRLGQVMLHFNPTYQRMTLHRLAILRGGEVIDHTETAGVRFLQRETQLESGVYSGAITASLLLPDIRVGDALQVVVGVEGSNPILGERYSDLFGWDDAVPVERRRVVIVTPADRPLRWTWVGDGSKSDLPEPTESREGGERRLTFEGRQLAAVMAEPQLPIHAQPFRSLQVSEYPDWQALTDWASGLFRVDAELPPEVQTLVEGWRSLPDEDAKVSEALQWVQSNIRYYSMALGESSHRPQPPAVVLQQRYGDCKDKTLLLVTMLRALGVEADPVLVSLRKRKAISGWLPAPEMFDHAIVRVRLKDEVYFLDPTRLGQVGPVNRMGQSLEDAEVLVVQGRDQGATVIRSPLRREIFLSEMTERFVIDRFDAPGRLEVSWAFHGSGAESMRLRVREMPPERRREWVMQDYERRYPGIMLLEEPQFLDDVRKNRLEMKLVFEAPGLAQRTERGDWLVRYAPAVLQGSLALPERLTRSLPLGMGYYPMTLVYEASVQWPDVVSVISNPRSTRIESDAFVANFDTIALGNEAKHRVRLEVTQYEVKPQGLSRLVENVRRFDREVPGVFVADRSQIHQAKAGVQAPEGFRDRFIQQMREMADEASKTLEQTNLSEQDVVGALCMRSAAHHEMGDNDRGYSDSNQAVRRFPRSGEAWSCRASSQFRSGRLQSAISDYSRALVLGHPPEEVLYWRAIARYYDGQVAQAAAEFEQAVRAKRDESERTYAQLWWYWSLSQSGQPIPPELRSTAAGRRDDLWPAPALALHAGIIKPEDLLALARSRNGGAGELALAEAWFYIGQWHKSQGRSREAQEAFRNTLAQNATMYLEHTAAEYELR